MSTFEVNFDGLIGPTHHYGGLAMGNLASQVNAGNVSHPREAALQGLRKMKLLHDRGVRQAILPPHERPHIGFLKSHGFHGTDQEIIQRASRERPDLLSIAYSASAMWAANAATVSPSSDTADGRVHITPANLISTQHRALEATWTTRLLTHIFSDAESFLVHGPLPADAQLSDEGAANHMRLAPAHGEPGCEVFVYGRDQVSQTTKFPARQSLAASECVAQQHSLDPARRLFVQQNPSIIDEGVFHNDVIAVANENVLLCHERAYVDQLQFLSRLKHVLPGNFHVVEVTQAELSVEEAVRTYLFNSQLVSLPQGGMLLLCPAECAESSSVARVLDRMVADVPVLRDIQFVDVRQSMRNGGGPACLRLRVVLTAQQWRQVHPGVQFTTDLFGQLQDWIRRHYRQTLTAEDLADTALLHESRAALDELTTLLNLGSLYDFQR